MKKRQVAIAAVRRSEGNPSSALREVVRYGECQKNHAASLGGYATDGCREFMASGEEGTANALNCAACGCHRNFHKRQVQAAEVVCEYTPPSQSRGRDWDSVFSRPLRRCGEDIDSENGALSINKLFECGDCSFKDSPL
ncbi:hypothetical protein SAY87_006433 [Trapa incisa]|uniref:ZF-HD dimerization-type domain-containing protein n=1 Tax=Trapa incisa TaxID=236973 RepID=A0AAN7JXW6_9MYRT|nr:hypothetical protein SAY87_006433 [Trapa incisa]